MTVVLDTDPILQEESRLKNALFVILLDVVGVAGITLGANAAGMSWGWSLAVGAAAGAAATLVSMSILIALLPVASLRACLPWHKPTEDEIRHVWAIDLWDADAEIERLQARARRAAMTTGPRAAASLRAAA
ncbi:hypothetical protein SAMN05216376_102464 [Mameliella alba]|uniref:hypothetical protein n=1 Tax=Mameliella alba TaxID=561184 RepID=UPI00087E0D0D|nr:hypothetical protein [Mameliella alba]OWV49423.1 hypothetical protein CDZ96_03275 [Mameliella alba]PTR41382.1 hypothetical protein LX94_00666 [Mameliella alba]GGF51008.1 hypothetical protein GCM10011319_10740 [Mameliella alba]SDC44239.1 hypothetical protein SAMN05216376_102464 [Mameliella alba]